MTREEAVQLATAIAKANGNPHAEEWAQKVGENFEPSDAPPPPADEQEE